MKLTAITLPFLGPLTRSYPYALNENVLWGPIENDVPRRGNKRRNWRLWSGHGCFDSKWPRLSAGKNIKSESNLFTNTLTVNEDHS